MNIEKLVENAEESLQDIVVSPDNLVKAIIKLLEIAHVNGLDSEAIKALAECGIQLEITEA